MSIRLPLSVLAVGLLAGLAPAQPKAVGPKVGDTAKDFELTAQSGKKVRLSKLAAEGPVVLVVLRGYPGYQCPLCTRQFADLLGKTDEFKRAGARVVFVYPGPADGLTGKAAEFVKGRDYPAHFSVLLDPDYTFTTAYGLRWDARNETAYPSTFVIGKDRVVTFAKVSTTHGDRSKMQDVLAALGGR